jgi:hypothetical protein
VDERFGLPAITEGYFRFFAEARDRRRDGEERRR